MALTASTLSAAVTADATVIPVAANTGSVTPNFTTGSYSYAYVDQEFMLVLELISTTAVKVKRGQMGTKAVSHASGAAINFGVPADFSGQPIGSFTYQPLYGIPTVPLRANASQSTFTTTLTQSTGYGFLTSTAGNAAVALLLELRAAMVAFGLIKGSA